MITLRSGRRRRPRSGLVVLTVLVVLVGTALLLATLLTTAAAPAHAISTDPVPPEVSKGRVLVLRPGRIDVVREGIVRRSVMVGPQVSLVDLPDLIGDTDYVTWSRAGVVRLSATIAQRPGSVLVSGGPEARRLELDETGTVPVQLVGTRATLRLQGTSIALAGAGLPRPPVIGAIRYVNRSTVDLNGVTVTGLGDPAGRVTAIEISSGSVVTLRSVRIERGGPGLHLDGVARARLINVTAWSTRGAGVRVSGGRAVVVRALNVSENSGDGLRIAGPVAGLDVSGVTAADNHGTGVTLLTQRGGTLARVRTTHNRGDGVALRAVSGTVLDHLASAWDLRAALTVEGGSGTTVRRLASQGGVVVVNGSTRLRLDDLRIRWIPRAALKISGRDVVVHDADVDEVGDGIVVGAGAVGVTSRPVTASGVTLTGGTVVGRHAAVRVSSSASGTTLDAVTGRSPGGVALQVSGSSTHVRAGIWSGATGVRVRDRATDVVLEGCRVTSTGPALEVPPTGVGTVTVTGATLTGGGRKAVASTAGQLTLRWTVVSGAALGVDLRGDGVLDDTQVSGSHQGLRVARGHRAVVQRGRFQAQDLGIEAVPGGTLHVRDSVVRADLATRGTTTFTGHNDLSPRPLRGLALAAAGMLVAALTLESVRRLRERTVNHQVDAPSHVLNRS